MAAVTLRTFDSIELHRLLSKDEALRSACAFPQVPHRKTIGRRLSKLIPAAEEQIGRMTCLPIAAKQLSCYFNASLRAADLKQ